jgi:hypothetical protein
MTTDMRQIIAFPRKRIVHVFTSRLGGTSRTAAGAMKTQAHALSAEADFSAYSDGA